MNKRQNAQIQTKQQSPRKKRRQVIVREENQGQPLR